MIDDNYEDWAYEQARQRKVDADWMLAEDEAAKELSFRQDQQLKELEMRNGN